MKPPLKPKLRNQGACVVPRSEVEDRNGELRLYTSDSNPCQHRWIALKWSGYECNDCDGWYCA